MNIHAGNTVERSRGEVSGGVDDEVGAAATKPADRVASETQGRVDLGRGDRRDQHKDIFCKAFGGLAMNQGMMVVASTALSTAHHCF